MSIIIVYRRFSRQIGLHWLEACTLEFTSCDFVLEGQKQKCRSKATNLSWLSTRKKIIIVKRTPKYPLLASLDNFAQLTTYFQKVLRRERIGRYET